jgi:hypothetical protein
VAKKKRAKKHPKKLSIKKTRTTTRVSVSNPRGKPSPALKRARAEARRWRHKAESLLEKKRAHKKLNPRRPPGRWWDRCLASVTAQRHARDPAAVCGAAWWRMPAHERAAIVRKWEHGSARQRRVAVAVAKAERNRAMRGGKKKTRR